TEIKVWDVGTGKEVYRLTAPSEKPYYLCPAFSPDGKLLAWSDRGGAVHLADAATGRLLRKVAPGEGPTQFAFTPDGKGLVTLDYIDNLLVTWDAATGKELRRAGKAKKQPPGARIGVYTGLPVLSVSPDCNRVATATHDFAVVILDTATGKDA